MSGPIRIHPQNQKIFEFRSKSRILVCATEHYGAVMNRPFCFERYLADAAEKSQTLTRTFMLFREFQSMLNPYSTCKPESTDYIAPFKRVGPGYAADGLLKYDLSQWNPEFFERLHRFLSSASNYGIIVEVVLLSNTYCPEVWSANPLNLINNVNDVEEIQWPEYMSKRHPKLFAWQCALVQKIVEETNRHDNIFYEICNEPGGLAKVSNAPTLDEVNGWQMALAQVIRTTEDNLSNKHLIAGQEAFAYTHALMPGEVQQLSGKSFKGFGIDIVNMHPLSNMTYGDKVYNLGRFMSKELKLGELQDYCLATYQEKKPLNLDEDNVASRYRDYDGWTIHRKRAWTTLFCGCHYDYIDFSIIIYCETGTPESQRCIRTWIKHLSEYIHSVDLVRAKPVMNWLQEQPEHTVASVFGIEAEDYNVYLADSRELDEPKAGSEIEGDIVFDLPGGDYKVACYSPVTGLYSFWFYVKGGEVVRISVPAFRHDIVVRITGISTMYP